MSTYTRPDKFIPINISSSPENYLNYVQKRLDLSAQGQAMVNMQYKQILDLDLTHDANKEKLNGFLSSMSEQINKYAGSDLSNFDNVKKAISVFDPLTKDKQYESILYDNKFTKHYRDQFNLVEEYKQKTDKKGVIGAGYGVHNYNVLMNSYNKFRNSKNPSDYSNWGSLDTYQPYYDDKAEVQKLTESFLKLPDDYEIETLGENGMTTKVKFKGKTAADIQQYLNVMLSDKARNQMAIEGRSYSYQIDDATFEKTMKDSLNKNIKNIDKDIYDLKVSGSYNGKKLTKDEISQIKNELESQKQSASNKLNDFNDNIKRQEILADKENIYANYYTNEKIANLSSALDNKRMDQTLGTNQAYVSMLNRQQGWQEFILELEAKRESDAKKLEFEYRKEGLDPKTGKPILGSPSNETAVPTPITGTVEEVVKNNEAFEKEINDNMSKVAIQVIDNAYDALGLDKNESFFNRTQNNVKALQYVKQISDELISNSGRIKTLMSKPESELTAKEKADKNIVLKLKENEADVAIANSYYDKKNKLVDKTRAEIKKTFADAGIKSVQDLEGNLVLQAYSDYPTLDNLIDAMIKNPELAQQVNQSLNRTDVFSVGSQGLKIAGKSTGNPIIDFISGNSAKIIDDVLKQNSGNVSAPVEELHKNIGQSFATSGMHKVMNRPIATQTNIDKTLNSQFNNFINNTIVAKYGDILKEKGIEPSMINSIETHDGYYLIKGSTSQIDEETGKIIKKGETFEEKLTSPDLTVTSAIERKYAQALGMSENGSLNMNYTSDLSSYPYRVRTTSGTPYQMYSSQTQPLTLELEINGKVVQLPATFNTVGAAKQQMEETINALETEVTNEVFKEEYQKALKESGDTQEAKQIALKKLNELSKSELPLKIKERIEKMYQTGTIFDVFGLQNPQLTRTQQQLQDLINGN
jgi:hypothetical protein